MLIDVMPNSIMVIKKKGFYVANGLSVLYFDFHTATINEMLDQ
jgi:hypothetical protein